MNEVIKRLAKDLDKLKFFLASNDVECVENDNKCDIDKERKNILENLEKIIPKRKSATKNN